MRWRVVRRSRGCCVRYGHFLLNRDAFDEALELNARELALEPASLLSNRYRAQMLFVARRYDECEAQSHRTVRLDPRDLVLSHSWLARCLEQQGKRDQAVEAWEHGRDVRGGAEIATRLRVQYRSGGWTAYWRERIRVGEPQASNAAPFVLARVGRVEEALQGLERLYDVRHPVLTWMNHPELDPLRDDPRFQALRRRVGFSESIDAELAAQRRTARR